MTLPAPARRLAVSLCLVLAALAAVPSSPAVAETWNGRFSVWHDGAFAPQYLDASCVGATIQITLNLITGHSDHSKRNQLEYLDYAQTNSKYPVTDNGADPEGWALALIHFGAGDDWGWSTAATMEDALHTAAKQIRETNKPAGLLVHYGRHAWVMSGFEATADPATTDDFTVTAAEVVGPLWPTGTLNGTHFDPGPQTWQDIKTLARKFDAYVEPDQPAWYGKYVTVLPKASEGNVPSSPDPQQQVDIRSASGWIWVFDQLARKFAVRDLLWMP